MRNGSVCYDAIDIERNTCYSHMRNGSLWLGWLIESNAHLYIETMETKRSVQFKILINVLIRYFRIILKHVLWVIFSFVYLLKLFYYGARLETWTSDSESKAGPGTERVNLLSLQPSLPR